MTLQTTININKVRILNRGCHGRGASGLGGLSDSAMFCDQANGNDEEEPFRFVMPQPQ
jgi:hypothetical protein